MFSDGQRALPSEPKALMGLVTHPGLSLRFFRTHPQSNRSAELSTPTSLPKLSPEGIQRKTDADRHSPHTLADTRSKNLELRGGGGEWRVTGCGCLKWGGVAMPSALAKDCHTPGRGGFGVGARRNKGRDRAQRSSGCSKGPWVNSTVSVMLLLVRGGKEGNPEAHVSVQKKKLMLNRSG